MKKYIVVGYHNTDDFFVKKHLIADFDTLEKAFAFFGTICGSSFSDKYEKITIEKEL